MDTVRADHLSTYGYSRPTSPNLDQVAARGVQYTRAFSQGNESLFSHASILVGRYPSEVATPDYTRYGLPAGALLLPEILQLYGYKTGGFTSGGHVIADFGFNQGFHTFQTSPGLGFGSFYDTVPLALGWIGKIDLDQPWFAFVHSYDAHAPYVRPDPFYHLFDAEGATERVDALLEDPLGVEVIANNRWYRDRQPQDVRHVNGRPILAPSTYTGLAEPMPGERVEELTPGEIEHIRAHYDGGIAYADLFLGALLAQLQERGLLEQTLVIVVSDHGEDLLDHGWVNHRTALTDSTTHVPFLVMGPGFSPGTVVDELVDARDIVPTALHAAGAVVPAGLKGRALQELGRKQGESLQAAFAEGVMDMAAVRTERWRLVDRAATLADPGYGAQLSQVPLESSRFELFDSMNDPGEQVNLLVAPSGEQRAIAESLRGEMVRWREGLVPGDQALKATDVSPEVRAALKARGYWDPRQE